MSASFRVEQWPDWTSDVRAPMRAQLSSRLIFGRCSMCRQRRRCRYALVIDALFCSEDCWDDHQKQIQLR